MLWEFGDWVSLLLSRGAVRYSHKCLFVHWIFLGHPLMVYCGRKELNITFMYFMHFKLTFLIRSTGLSDTVVQVCLTMLYMCF